MKANNDDGTAALLRCNSVVIESGGSLWSYGVQGNQDIFEFKINVTAPGWHTLRVIKADAGIVFDKIVLTHESARQITSKLGAPESYQTICEAKTSQLAALPEFSKDTVSVEDGDAAPSRLYDFTADAAKAQEGYLAVTSYVSDSRYGWTEESAGKVSAAYKTDAVKCSDRDKGFVYGTEKAFFYVNGLVPGVYSVGLAAGDRSGAGMSVKNMSVYANGKEALKNIDVDAGHTMEYVFHTEIGEDGKVQFEFAGDLWAVTSLEIWPYEETRNDKGNGYLSQIIMVILILRRKLRLKTASMQK